MHISRRSLIAAVAAAPAVTLSRELPGQHGPFYEPVATGEDLGPPLPLLKASTRPVMQSPAGYPNALCLAEEGLWVAEQRFDRQPERIWHMDWNGRVLEEITSDAKDTSGVAYGNGLLYICADDVENPGIFTIDLHGHTVNHRQIPLGPPRRAGGGHGATWHDGHLWVTANRARAILKIEPTTWSVDYLIPFNLPTGLTRYHGCAALEGSMYMVSGNESQTYADGGTNLIRYDIATGAIIEIYEFTPGSCDPHGLMAYEGKLYGCDSGFHPGWNAIYDVPGLGKRTSPHAGKIFEIILGA